MKKPIRVVVVREPLGRAVPFECALSAQRDIGHQACGCRDVRLLYGSVACCADAHAVEEVLHMLAVGGAKGADCLSFDHRVSFRCRGPGR